MFDIEIVGCINCPFCHWIEGSIQYGPYCWLSNSKDDLEDFLDNGIYRGSYPDICRLSKEEVEIKFIKI